MRTDDENQLAGLGQGEHIVRPLRASQISGYRPGRKALASGCAGQQLGGEMGGPLVTTGDDHDPATMGPRGIERR